MTTEGTIKTPPEPKERKVVVISPSKRRRLVPHRRPWVVLGKDVRFYPDEVRAESTMEMKSSNFFFKGHLPRKPLFPGVIAIELAAQLGVVAAKMANPEMKGRDAFFTNIDKVEFGRPILPGATVSIETTLTEHSTSAKGTHKFTAKFIVKIRRSMAVSGIVSGAAFARK